MADVAQILPLLVEVRDNLEAEIGLKSMAGAFGCSPFHFHRLFREAVGETPKRHVARLRLERAAYKLAVTDESIVEVGLSVGFNSHETFARAFRRWSGLAPSAYRRAAKSAQVERMQRNEGFRGEGCLLSEVWFTRVRPTPALAIRRIGEYAQLHFDERRALWDEILAWAAERGVSCGQMRLGLFPDDPTLTPPELQTSDICIPVDRAMEGEGRIRCIELAGGLYGMIEHFGPYDTVGQAYRTLADGIRRTGHVFREDPPIHLFAETHIDGDPDANRSQIWFPVRRPA